MFVFRAEAVGERNIHIQHRSCNNREDSQSVPTYISDARQTNYIASNYCWKRPNSSVGIATGYGLDGPGIESRWGEIFHRPDLPWGPPSLLYNGYRVFPGGRKRPGRDSDPSPPSSDEV